MNIRYPIIAFLVSLNAIASLGNSLYAQEPTITAKESIITPETSSAECLPNANLVSQRIQLFYYRQATNIVNILRAIPSLKCLAIANYAEDSIILTGQQDLIEKAYQVIASIDLPLPGIDMQMWGIQISSDDPGDLAQVMSQIREEINLTQQLLQDTLAVLKQYVRNIPQEESLDIAFELEFQGLINSLGYESFLNLNRPLSLIDIVLSGDAVSSAEDSLKFNQVLYSHLIEFMNQDPRYEKYLAAMKEKGRPPFDRFFRSRGLQPKCAKYQDLKKQQKCETWNWVEISPGTTENYVKINRKVLLEFALQYGNFVANPSQFSPYKLQQTANALNDRLQDTTNALNKDIEDFFVGATLDNIQEIVSRFGDVDYAQVGRTTIASLNGIETTVRSNSVSAFDVTPPLKLSELLANAENLSQQINSFIPTETLPGATEATELTAGGIPISRVIGLLAAFAEQESKFRELNTGVTLKFTPNVLRNMNSAELKIDLTIVDPTATGTASEGVPPLSRIGEQTVTTSVYTDAVDLFALSTFSNQSTLEGGRGYVPVIGQVWRGIFSAIPGFGQLFSWKKAPKNVLHESILLTNSFITPTSMGLALLYPINETERFQFDTFSGIDGFCYLEEQVERYIANQFGATYEKNWQDRRCGGR
ncbi:MAG: hypothetical protein AB4368_01875 [Xenococcaceae cyanobacterium]